MLEQEIAYYEAHLDEWLKTSSERVALIKGDVFYGFYDNEDAAITEGARRFGLQSFLARRVRAQQPIIRVSRLFDAATSQEPAAP